VLNRIAVTNPSAKTTPNMQVTGPGRVAIIEHSQNSRPHGDGAPYDGKLRKNQDILRPLRRLTTFSPQLGA